jgi:hypothetical protein
VCGDAPHGDGCQGKLLMNGRVSEAAASYRRRRSGGTKAAMPARRGSCSRVSVFRNEPLPRAMARFILPPVLQTRVPSIEPARA